MSAQVLFFAAAVGVMPASGQPATVYRVRPVEFSQPATHFLQRVAPSVLSEAGRAEPAANLIARGQNVPYEEDPNAGSSLGTAPAPSYVAPAPWLPGANWLNPFAVPPPQDPFLGVPGGGPTAAMPWGGPSLGINGPQPFRFGWMSRGEVGFIPQRSADDAAGDFGVLEADVELKYTSPVLPGIIFSIAPQFNYRAWDGPSRIPSPVPGRTSSLPGSAYRLGLDLIWQTPANAPWSALIAFNPSLNTDFNASLGGDAWNWDGRGMLFYRYSPQWMFAGGAGYLDRVNDRVIPYAGFVYTPDDRWEFRIMYPESRISRFLGNCWGWAQWLYARGEYHIEAYQFENRDPTAPATTWRDRVELEDYRLLIGLRTEVAGLSGFAEVGWVLGRDIDFDVAKTSFHPNTGFIARLGLRY